VLLLFVGKQYIIPHKESYVTVRDFYLLVVNYHENVENETVELALNVRTEETEWA
jgi:hypothetical protein